MPIVDAIFSYRSHFVLEKHKELGSKYFLSGRFSLDHEAKDGSYLDQVLCRKVS